MNQMGHVFNGFAIQGQEICNKDSKTSVQVLEIKVTNNNNYKTLEPYLDKGFLIFVVYFGSTNFRIFFIRSLSQLVSLVPEVDNCCRKVLRLQFITFLT